MASSTIRPTAFPRFDTLSADPRQVSLREDGAPEYRRRQYSYAHDVSAQPKGRNALLQSYSRFIASFTGESEDPLLERVDAEVWSAVEDGLEEGSVPPAEDEACEAFYSR